MEDKSFDIAVDANSKHYKGWATPSKQVKENGLPKSFHIVLDGVMFGNISYNDAVWTVDEDRPEVLTEALGRFIEARYK